jgi:capsular exopolysaccharide synthesis family protein
MTLPGMKQWLRGWRLVTAQKWLVAAITGTFVVIGAAYAILAYPVYQANALLQVAAGNGRTLEQQLAAQLALLRSPDALGPVITQAGLDYNQAVGHFTLFGDFMARHFKPTADKPLANALFGLNAYGWGGERLQVKSLQVPAGLLNETLTLVTGENGQYTLFAPQKVALLQGQVGQPAQGRGVTLTVETLVAHPGTLFYFTRSRVSTMAMEWRNRLQVTQGPPGSGLIYLAVQDRQAELAQRGLDAISRLNAGTTRIVDSATVDIDNPASPQRGMILLTSLLLGLLASFALIFTRRLLDQGLDGPDSLESIGLPVFASLPWSQRQKRLNGRSQLLCQVAIEDLAMEALRSLRTSLYFGMLQARNRAVVFTGINGDAGTTFICSNLATILAQGRQRVLLVDGDLRRGRLHELFKVIPFGGLSDALSGRLHPDQLICETEIPGLDIVASGTVTGDTGPLLVSAQFNSLLLAWSARYDLVIIDTPAISAGPDAGLIGRQAGALLLVARMGKYSLRNLDTCKQKLMQEGVPVKGAVYNAETAPPLIADSDSPSYSFEPASPRK